MDLVEAVIGLASNLFYGTGLAACVLVLRKRKPNNKKGKVLIADASRLFRRGQSQNYLEPQQASQIVQWYHAFSDVQDSVRIVTLKELKEQDWTLNISRYVLPAIQDAIPPLDEAVLALKEALRRCKESEDALSRIILGEGWIQ
jgi:type I restriction enzyme M protein